MTTSKTFKMNIDLDNDSFGVFPAEQIAVILNKVKHDLRNGLVSKSIKDSNGNVVGRFTIEIT